MRSELKEYNLDASLSRGVWWEDHLVLKNEIDLITKELDLVLKKNESLKIDIDSHVCHASVASSSSTPIACSTLSSSIEKDINVLKKSV